MKVKTKKCSKCGEVKLLALFHRNPKSKDKHSSACAKCRRVYQINSRKSNVTK